jgi:hypothetical protein
MGVSQGKSKTSCMKRFVAQLFGFAHNTVLS